MVPKYTIVPRSVEAMQWLPDDPDCFDKVQAWVGRSCVPCSNGRLDIDAAPYSIVVRPRAFIVKSDDDDTLQVIPEETFEKMFFLDEK